MSEDRKNSLLYTAFGLVALLGALHIFAILFYFYWSIGWFDVLMHFLGGLSLGVLVFWVVFLSGFLVKKMPGNPYSAVFITFVMVLVIGVLWEVFEYVYDIAAEPHEYVSDTIVDIIMDSFGALVAGFYGLAKSRPNVPPQTNG